jgi:TRAP-type uncharacterized transport system fused permease subunit
MAPRQPVTCAEDRRPATCRRQRLRRPRSARAQGRPALLGVALAWSLFQLWIASPLPFSLGIGVFNDTQSRAIHLAFAVFLAYLAYPAFKRSPRERVPLLDWVFGAGGRLLRRLHVLLLP